jgi:peptide/nickel transport system permease protein
MSIGASPVGIDREGVLWRAFSGIRGSWKASAAGLVCIVLLLLAIFGPWLTPQNPYLIETLDIFDGKLPPGTVSSSGEMTYWLGTDVQGRDMLSAMVYGLRTSLFVGVLAGMTAMLVGAILGLIAAYFGGIVSTVIMRVADVMLGFPTMLVALMLLAFIGQGVGKIIFALILVQWATFARAVRGVTLVEQNKQYITAARTLGFSKPRIMFGHLLPNCLSPLVVLGTIQVANAISTEATLSFLGIGLPITQPSLGLLISNGYRELFSGNYWLSLFPGLLLLVLVFSINIVGDRLREVLNPRLMDR